MSVFGELYKVLVKYKDVEVELGTFASFPEALACKESYTETIGRSDASFPLNKSKAYIVIQTIMPFS